MHVNGEILRQKFHQLILTISLTIANNNNNNNKKNE